MVTLVYRLRDSSEVIEDLGRVVCRRQILPLACGFPA